MRLAHTMFREMIEFAEGKVNVLIIEEAKLYRRTIEMLLNQIEGEDGDFVLSEKIKVYELKKSAMMITDPFNIELNAKKLLTKLNKLALDEAMGYELQMRRILEEINELGAKVASALPFSVTFGEAEDFSKLIEMIGLRIDEDMPLTEKVLEYMKLYRSIMNTELFIFVGLRGCMTADELREFYKAAAYEKFRLLIIENYQREAPNEYEIMKIIDKDLCEL